MIKIPDSVIIDFCEWLSENIQPDELFDIITDNEDLEPLAGKFLQQRQIQSKTAKSKCPFRLLIKNFLDSDEFYRTIRHCERHCSLKNRYHLSDTEIYRRCSDCMYMNNLRSAFRHYIERTADEMNYLDLGRITRFDLAFYMQHLYLEADGEGYSPEINDLMTKIRRGEKEELDFLKWLSLRDKEACTFKNIPSVIFENLVDEYLLDTNSNEQTKKKLMKAYKTNGWEGFLNRFELVFRKRNQYQDLNYIIGRFYDRSNGFKCIILPLSDRESTRIYHSLITDRWNDLNRLSRNYLDIFYSEAECGKSGCEIADKIKLLPKSISVNPPCIALWKDDIKNAKAVKIDNLDDGQIYCVIRLIVEKIQQNKDLNSIVEEVNAYVKDVHAESNGSNILNIHGDGNVVGDHNTVYSNITKGDNNRTNISDNQIINSFDLAIQEINKSCELNDNQKKNLSKIMTEAKKATEEKSEEKAKSAKSKFNLIKDFLVSVAPTLIGVLANMAEIASFFGISAIH